MDNLSLVGRKLEIYDKLNLRGKEYDPIGWIALHFSCSRKVAEKLILQYKTSEHSKEF